MSFGMIAKNAEENEIKKEIQALIQKISKDKKILMIASSGSIDDHRDSYPSSLPECISVGCLTSNFQRHPSSRKTSTLDIMAPGDGIFSLIDKENISKDSGTSQAAAFISGVCALILEKFNSGNINLEEVKNKLYETAFSESFIPEEFGNGIVNPNKLFNALKKI